VASIRVEILRPESAEGYDRYLLGRPETLFYHGSKYKEFLKGLLGCEEEYLLAFEGGEIRGAFPLMFAERGGRRVYNSLPFYGSNGGIVADDERARRELLGAYREVARRETTVSSTVIENPFAGRTEEGLPHNLTDQRVAQFTAVAFSSGHREEIMSRIDASARRNVSKAAREGVTVEVDHSQFPRLREMHRENIEAIGGLPKTDEFFRLVPAHFAPGRDYDLYVAKRGGLVVAGLLVFYFNRTVEYFTPAVEAEFRTLQPLSLILIEAMTEASRRGFRVWNWGGTWVGQTGVYRFKRKWAAAERRYDYFTQLNDAALLEWPRERLLKTFPNFYVAPFSALKAKEETV
jgi:CelD/BcsL family acetyltransferase involved in cellulose biosynthesis